MKNLKIINRSKWPDYALKVLCPWIVKRAGITWSYTITVRSTTKNTWRGMGWKHKTSIVMDRRFAPGAGRMAHQVKDFQLRKGLEVKPIKYAWPYVHKDHRFQDILTMTFDSRIELLVFLLAHEAHHAVGGNREHWMKGGRVDKKAMEIECNEEGMQAVREYRDQHKYFMVKFQNALVDERAKIPTPLSRAEQSFDKVQRQLWNWQSKLQRAQKKVKTYNQKLQYYNKRLAALKGE